MPLFGSPIPDVAIREVTIAERLFEGLQKAPDRVVLIDGPSGNPLTGAELMAQSGAMARGIGLR